MVKHYTNFNIKKLHRGSIILIGNFDGLHLGHQKLFQLAQSYKKKYNLKIGVVNFDPMPKMFFNKKLKNFRLSNINQKIKLLSNLKVDFVITKKFNNREVGAAVEAETSGSEIVLTYSPGTFDSPTTASIGDVLGSIVWEDESLRRRFKEVEEAEREAAIGMRIKGVIDDANEDGTFIRSSMRFEIGSAESTAVTEYLRLEEGTFRVTSSGLLWVDNNDILQGNYLTDADRRIRFLNQTSNKRWTIGVDESQQRFIIHQGTSFSSNSDFEIDYSGNVVLAGSITATRGNFSSGIPTFTGSTIAINGGTF